MFSAKHFIPLLMPTLFFGCSPQETSIQSEKSLDGPVTSGIKLVSLPASRTGINFINQVDDHGKVNIFTWHFLYNGAGVAAGDINNDGLTDLYFAGGMRPDRLYLNKGDFHFEDITASSGIGARIWSSGVTMADVNADGLLDIYVCKNSPTGIHDNNRNLLLINSGKNTFTEAGQEYGLADTGFGVQSTFFDADQDGDLDMYLVNQPFDEFARLVNRPDIVAAYPQTDRMYFNENGKFVDHTTASGMVNARYGLSVALGDFDLNGWTDLYVCNDYHHGDHLYMNHGGTFNDESHERMGHISFYSMGSDVGDVNQDGWLDLITLDMAFEDHYRSKTNMGSMDPDRFWSLVGEGQHYQYMQNTLQMNRGNGYFSDAGQIAGISKSDWSNATLFSDLDHDGDQDILITNGILKDLRNNDFQVYVKEKFQNRVGPDNYLELLNNLPSTPIHNVIYTNEGDGHFSKLPAASGFDTGDFSHGMAVADFNNDGLMDVVINNMNSTASFYQNVSDTKGHYVNVRLKGPEDNRDGLGCTVILYAGGRKQINTMQTTRGYFSSSPPVLHFGLGAVSHVDSIKVHWDHKSMSVITKADIDKENLIDHRKAKKIPFAKDEIQSVRASDADLVQYTHQETDFNDYGLQVLIPYKQSQHGPFITVGDANGDDAEDFFVGGGAGQSAMLYVRNADGSFSASAQKAFEQDKSSEDLEAAFFDSDGDGDQDLIVTGGSNEFSDTDKRLRVRLYINDGQGNYALASAQIFPDIKLNGQCVEIWDADHDDDLDVFLGGRLVAGKYPVPASSVILLNEGGRFSDQTQQKAGFLADFGLVTDAITEDKDGDGDMDLLVVGEWMAPTWIINNGKEESTMETIESAGTGLWWTIEKGDFDKDGDNDLILGNLGWNNKFGGSQGTKLEVFANDFDGNGDFDVVLASTKQDKLLPVRGRECSSQEMPFILDKFPSYESYAKAQLSEILPEEELQSATHAKLSTLSSLVLWNKGSGQYESAPMPALCQAGPVKALYADDFNSDGFMDYMFAGNHFPTEVETARYDGLYPGICFSDGKGGWTCELIFIDEKLRIDDVRDIQKITTKNNEAIYLMTTNNGPLRQYVVSGE